MSVSVADVRALKKFLKEDMNEHHKKAMDAYPKVLEFVSGFGVSIKLDEKGVHWRFMRGSSCVVQYWPSTQKMMEKGRPAQFCAGPREVSAKVQEICEQLKKAEAASI